MTSPALAPTYKVFRADGLRVLYWRARRVEDGAIVDLGAWERRAAWTSVRGWVRA